MRAIIRKSCMSSAVQRHCFLLFSSDWSSWDRRKLLATVLKPTDKGLDLLIKFLLSAFDISAKLYPLQEQQASPSLQRDAHSVTCNYGIYCRVKCCLGCTCLPRTLHTAPQWELLVQATFKLAYLHASAQGPRQHTHLAGRCRSLLWGRCERPPRPSTTDPAHLRELASWMSPWKMAPLMKKLKGRSHAGWGHLLLTAGCWLQAGSHPFLWAWPDSPAAGQGPRRPLALLFPLGRRHY